MCSDPERLWYPQRQVCYPTMERDAAMARWRSLHEEMPWHDGTFKDWSKERSEQYPYHRDSGVTIYVTAEDMSPDDDFLKAPSTQVDTEADIA